DLAALRRRRKCPTASMIVSRKARLPLTSSHFGPSSSMSVHLQILDGYWTREVTMARTIRDTSLESRTARGRLRARGKPYYRSVEPRLHLGYRKPLGGAGKWIARHYVGGQRYEVEVIGVADDFSDADGVRIISYRQAQALARERATARAHHAAGKHGPLTVADAMEAYFEFLEAHRRTAHDARVRAEALIIPELGDVEVQALTAERIRKWHLGLAKMAARVRTRAGAKQQHAEQD